MNTNSPPNNSLPIPHPTNNPLWTIPEAARFMKCSQRHVGNLQRAGMPFIKLGHLTRFDPKAIMVWMGLKQSQ